jgi:hypothetical protein
MRVEVCSSDDYERMDRLLSAIRDLAGRSEGDDWGLGLGLHRYTFPEGELTVFVDAWQVDVAGPEGLVQNVLQGLSLSE